LQEAGFSNINIDLIFGIPGQTVNDLKFNLEKSLSLNIPHLSVYGLTIEKGTPLYQGLKRNTFNPVNEEMYEAMFLTAHACLEDKGYIHYEISNYAKDGYKSKHNLNCWQGRDYLGFGPSAHSRVADLRWANPEDIEAYLKDPTKRSFNKKLTKNEIRLEERMLGLRTRYGICIPQTDHAEHIEVLKKKKLVEQIGNRIFLTANGMLLLDEIILFLEGKRA
jgi:oxygen-independent coproporphyrinogen-3 oxidase